MAPVTWSISGSDYSQVSPESPIYLRIIASHGSRLAETLVLESAEDPDLSRPINLPVRLVGIEDMTVVAAPDAVRIVRWVQGETSFWIELRQSTNEWFDDHGTLVGPSVSAPAQFVFGESARTSDLNSTQGVNASLPFATRDPEAREGEYSKAVSTLFDLDLSQSTMTMEGEASVLFFDFIRYDSLANHGNGEYSPEGANQLGIYFAVVYPIGSSKYCNGGAPQINTLSATRSDGNLRLFLEAKVIYSCLGARLFQWASGTYIHLTMITPGAAFVAAQSGVSGSTYPLHTSHGNEEVIGGYAYHRELILHYDGQSHASDTFSLDFKFGMILPENGQPIEFEIQTLFAPYGPIEDEAPYSAAYQVQYAPQFFAMEPQTLRLRPDELTRTLTPRRPSDTNTPHR